MYRVVKIYKVVVVSVRWEIILTTISPFELEIVPFTSYLLVNGFIQSALLECHFRMQY